MSADVALTPVATVRLTERVDGLVSKTDRLGEEVAKMGTVLQSLSKRVAAKSKSEEERGVQPDWAGCRNSIEAVEMLQTARKWVETYWVPYGYQPWAPCWPWHPPAVIAALFLNALTVQAYTNGKPSDVGDLYVRWMPFAARHVRESIGGCLQEAHRVPIGKQQVWTVDQTLLEAYAAWWAEDRTGVPPGLIPA